MIALLTTLRSVSWSAVFSTLLGASAILSAILKPEIVAAPIALGLASISLAILSTKN